MTYLSKNTMKKTNALVSKFSEDFIFGLATAAYQIEGAATEDGRGASIWDDFSHAGGNVLNDDNGDVACNHYHLWAKDLDLIQSLNVDAYRFSFAWPRVIPNGTGAINEKGMAFYDRLIDGCLERGLQTYATLYHWDLPSALQTKGGWAHRDTALAFADYASIMAERFGDRLDSICTFNEPWCSSILSNLYGIHAPGNKDISITLKTVHNQHVGHGLAVERIKAVRPELPTGIVLNLQSVYPSTDSVADQEAVIRHQQFHNGIFLDPLFKGSYPQEFINALGSYLPENWEHDSSQIQQPLDYWGLNYYTPARVSHDDKSTLFPQTHMNPPDASVERTDIGWEIAADTFEELIIDVYKHYDLPPLYITENGACINDMPVQGVIADERRERYLQQHINAVANAQNAGIPVKGYFAWSLMDNFEWAEGYTMRFGLVHVDYESQQRTIKQSGHWYANLSQMQRARRN